MVNVASQLDEVFALRAAGVASAIVRELFNARGCASNAKADGTPVSETDLRIEDALREMVRRERPADAFLGEERGETAGDGSGGSGPRRRWVVDPIDGTKSLVRGVPLFGCLIGLQIDGVNVLGVAAFPAICSGGLVGQTLIGRVADSVFSGQHSAIDASRKEGVPRGAEPKDADASVCRVLRGIFNVTADAGEIAGALSRAERVHVSGRRELAGATVCLTDPRAMLVDNAGWLGRLSAAIGPQGVMRSWGDCYGHALVASGQADVMIDSPMKIWDVVAIEPIIRAAGGVITDWQGGPPGDGSRGVISAASEELLREVAKWQSDEVAK